MSIFGDLRGLLVGAIFAGRAARPRADRAHRPEFLVRNGKREVEGIRLRLIEGVLFEADVDPRLAETVLRLDGRTPVRDALGEDAPRERAVAVLREMLETGFLEVPG